MSPPESVGYLEYDAGALGADEGNRVRDMLGERDLLIAELLAMVVEGQAREQVVEHEKETMAQENDLLRKHIGILNGAGETPDRKAA